MILQELAGAAPPRLFVRERVEIYAALVLFVVRGTSRMILAGHGS